MVLSFSRYVFVRPVVRIDKVTWLECHVAAGKQHGPAVFEAVRRLLEGQEKNQS
jgi:hypothetical protein